METSKSHIPSKIKDSAPRLISNAFVLDKLLKKVKPLDFKSIQEQLAKDKLSRSTLIIVCLDEVNRIIENEGFGVVKNDSAIYVFNGRAWSEINPFQLSNFLNDSCIKMGVDSYRVRDYRFATSLFQQFSSEINHFRKEDWPISILPNYTSAGTW